MTQISAATHENSPDISTVYVLVKTYWDGSGSPQLISAAFDKAGAEHLLAFAKECGIEGRVEVLPVNVLHVLHPIVWQGEK